MNTYMKYPRTFHLPWSEGVTSDDKIIKSLDSFVGERVIVTEKMDGENTSIYSDHVHARSIDSKNHPSRNWVKQFASNFQHNIDVDMRICGENLYARHSIEYDSLESYFLAFSVWQGPVCVDWDSTVIFLEALEVPMVPVLYDGIFDEEVIRSLYDPKSGMEGYVVRRACSFYNYLFPLNVCKFVRENHVQTTSHWMHQVIIPNKLRDV